MMTRAVWLLAATLMVACGDKDGDDSGTDDSASVAEDLDGDGVTEADGDCDDADAAVYPGNTEVPYDGLDNDCDAATPDDDLDGDGYVQAQDCDDADGTVNPGANEVCDGVDNNCDGAADEGVTATFYGDSDGDGYGADDVTAEGCAAPTGYVDRGGDCDDSDAAYNPGASESDCDDPADYNCDGSVGGGDNDGDGWTACEECRDNDASAYPGAPETCDNVDDDCDGDVDEGVLTTFYLDRDGDGYGDASRVREECTAPTSYVDNPDDCDDSESAVNPGAADDTYDGVDNDCDGVVDDDVPVYSHANDVQVIWDRYCNGCHVNWRTQPEGGLDLTDGYAEMVSQASGDVPSMDLVSPGDTARSYLWHKLSNTQSSVGGSGDPMPPPRSTQLGSAELAVIEGWIQGGAQP
ncbi:MAG: putative metal-binding motif-containing protein [Alphaproteobacteria bacterium]|nr:putative metal-binding motif-containing protein [Alphaproteobacteria bacterium]